MLSQEKVYYNKGNRFILSQIPEYPCRILDVGCGGGILGEILIGKGHSIDGITISEKERDLSSKFYKNIWVHNLENGLPIETKVNKYNIVVCSHILEHIAYPKTLLKEIRSVMDEEGRLLVALPNIMHYKSRIKLMLGKFDYQESGIWDYTHVRWYTIKSGKELFNSNGFTIIYSDVDGEIPFLSILKFLPKRIRDLLFFTLKKLSPSLFGYQLIYILACGK